MQPHHKHVANVLDTVVNIVRTRLQSANSLSTVTNGDDTFLLCVQALKGATLKAVMRQRLQDVEATELVHLQSTIEGELFSTYLESVQRALQENAIPLVAVDGPVWTTWRTHPTVGWLTDGAWHQHVPPLRDFYPTGGLQEYAETLLRTWTVLTFYWGTAALWPRCRHKQLKNGQDSFCDEPMLSHLNDGRVVACSETISRHGGANIPCGAPAVWCCHRHWNQAVCERCLGKRQSVLGGAGPNPPRTQPTGASTDIYNAVVTREESRTVGTVFHLTHVASRKPPSVPPNWRTTYRLQPAALVAVVKLSVSNEVGGEGEG